MCYDKHKLYFNRKHTLHVQQSQLNLVIIINLYSYSNRHNNIIKLIICEIIQWNIGQYIIIIYSVHTYQ